MLFATGYSGFITSGERIPWAGYTSIVLFITGFVLPLILEHKRLVSGFDKIENNYRTNRHRELNPPQVEVFAPQRTHQAPQRHRPPIRMVITCAIVATLLLGFDIVDFIVNDPGSAMPDDTISNY